MTRIPETEGIPEEWDDVECPECGSADVDADSLTCETCGADVDELLTERVYSMRDDALELRVLGLDVDDDTAREVANNVYVLLNSDTSIPDPEGVAPVLDGILHRDDIRDDHCAEPVFVDEEETSPLTAQTEDGGSQHVDEDLLEELSQRVDERESETRDPEAIVATVEKLAADLLEAGWDKEGGE